MVANGHAMPMKRKVVIQAAFDVYYTCVIENEVYVSESPEARTNLLGMDFLAKIRKFNNLRNPMLISTVFSGKGVKLAAYLGKRFPLFLQLNSVELPQDISIALYTSRVLTLIAKHEDKHLFPEKEQVSAYIKLLPILEFILIMSIVHMINQSTL